MPPQTERSANVEPCGGSQSWTTAGDPVAAMTVTGQAVVGIDCYANAAAPSCTTPSPILHLPPGTRAFPAAGPSCQ